MVDPRPSAASPVPPPVPTPQPRGGAGDLRPDDQEFLLRFLEPSDVRAIDEFSKEDQLFLGGIRSLWHSRKLELPVLPQSALRLRELLRAGDVAITQFVQWSSRIRPSRSKC